MEQRDNFVNSFLNKSYSLLSMDEKKKAEEYFSEIVDKLCSGQELDDVEKDFLDIYVSNYYTWLGGDYRRIYNHEAKLSPIHKKYAEYLLKNEEAINSSNVVFIIYYFSAIMCKEFGFKPYIKLDNPEYFKKNPNTLAVHTTEEITKAPIITFNPNYIAACIKDKCISSILNTIFHELEHEKQCMYINEKRITNAQSLIWAKEQLLRYVIGYMYYRDNYTDTFYERDARDYAYHRMKEIQKEYGDPNKEYDSYDFDNEVAEYDTSIKHLDVETGVMLPAIDLLDAVSCEYLKEYPQLLKKYPVLNVVFNENGTKKNIVQIGRELEEQKQRDIKLHPEDETKIDKEYSHLLYDIAKTDNDLLIQFLCLEADEFAKEDNIISLKIKMERIRRIMRDRNISYEEMVSNINRRIHELEKIGYNSPDYVKTRAEIAEERKLIRCLTEYNEYFKKQHDEKELERKYNFELQRIIKMNPEAEKFIVGDISDGGVVIAEKKTIEELRADYIEAKRRLDAAEISKEKYDELIQFIKKQYKEYIESSKTVEVPDRKYEGQKKH